MNRNTGEEKKSLGNPGNPKFCGNPENKIMKKPDNRNTKDTLRTEILRKPGEDEKKTVETLINKNSVETLITKNSEDTLRLTAADDILTSLMNFSSSSPITSPLSAFQG